MSGTGKVTFKITLTSDPKLPFKVVANTVQFFLEQILAQASVNVSWDFESSLKAFRWAKYCESLYGSLKETNRLQELDSLLKERGTVCEKLLLFQVKNVQFATVLLIEEFLRNPHLSVVALCKIFKALAETMSLSEFSDLCHQVVDRKAVYQEAVEHVQKNLNNEQMSLMKAIILKEHFLQDINKSTLSSKIQVMLKTVSTTENVLEVLYLLRISEREDEVKVRLFIIQSLELLLENWLQGIRGTNSINSLLAAPVKLTRATCEISLQFLRLWLRGLAILTENLQPSYFENDHTWIWPSDDSEHIHRQCLGLWFSFDQLVRHLESLLSVKDQVYEETLHFLAKQKQSGNLSIWMEAELRLNIDI